MSRIPITNEIRDELTYLYTETGLSPATLLRGAPNRPKGVSSRLIRQWMRGEAKSADKALLDYVLTLWRTIKATGKDDTIARVSLTPTLRAELTHLKNTTGKGAMSLLAGRKDKPKGLKSNIVTGWLNGTATTAKKSHLTYMMNLWSHADPLIPITQDMVDSYNVAISETRIPISTLLKLLHSKGVTLTRRQLDYRLKSGGKTIPKSEHEKMLKALQSIAQKVDKI